MGIRGRVPKAPGALAHQHAVDRRMALMAAHGRPRDEIAKEFGCDPATVYRRLNRPEVVRMMEEFRVRGEEHLEELLLRGAKRAAETLIELLASADDDVRYKASVRLGDMNGQAGKPAERVEMQTLSLHGDAAEAAFANALRDPAVRAYLSEHKQTAAELRKYLPPGVELAEIQTEEAPPDGTPEASEEPPADPVGAAP